MSYILDALRRADAERERGVVPSLQSQQHTIVDDDVATAPPRSLLWAVVALAVALLAVLAWSLLRPAAAPARAPVEGSITAPVPAPLPTLQPAPLPTPTATAPAEASPPPALAPTTVANPAPPPQRTAAPRADTAALPPAKAGVEPQRPATPPATKRAAAAPPAGTAPATTEPRVYSSSELPEEIRRDLPKIVIGGSSYSSAAASRMVMINGQVFHEGDRLAPDLVLERIRLKSAVFAFKGWRYEVLF